MSFNLNLNLNLSPQKAQDQKLPLTNTFSPQAKEVPAGALLMTEGGFEAYLNGEAVTVYRDNDLENPVFEGKFVTVGLAAYGDSNENSQVDFLHLNSTGAHGYEGGSQAYLIDSLANGGEGAISEVGNPVNPTPGGDNVASL